MWPSGLWMTLKASHSLTDVQLDGVVKLLISSSKTRDKSDERSQLSVSTIHFVLILNWNWNKNNIQKKNASFFCFRKKTLTISMVGSGHFLNLFNGVGKRYSQPRITQTAVTVIYPSIKHKSFSCLHFSL